MTKKVTPQQEMAIRALFDNGFSNKRKALDEAGYSKTVKPNAVFENPKVKKEIELRQKTLARKHNIEQDHIIAELAKMTFYGLGDLIHVDKDGEARLDFSKMTDNHRAGIKSFTSRVYMEGKGKHAREVKETKIEFVSKIQAQEALSKHLGLFDRGNDNAKDLIDALMAAKKRIRIGIQVDGEDSK